MTKPAVDFFLKNLKNFFKNPKKRLSFDPGPLGPKKSNMFRIHSTSGSIFSI